MIENNQYETDVLVDGAVSGEFADRRWAEPDRPWFLLVWALISGTNHSGDRVGWSVFVYTQGDQGDRWESSYFSSTDRLCDDFGMQFGMQRV